ncbi:MAG: glycosyltransferase [Atopobiaceae bacterium]|jgi:glycosyltransferase involved in cell wall biosynthesis
MNYTVIIPALEPTSQLRGLVEDLRACGLERIVVVDDGSHGGADVFAALERMGVRVVRHQQNKGKGAAIKTGIQEMRSLWPDAPGFVTCDADGQHSARDAVKLARTSQLAPQQLILGVRNLCGSKVPARSKLGARFSTLFFKLQTGITCTDTQTGLRCVPASLFSLAEATAGERYEYEMNFLVACARQGVTFTQVPIETRYFDHNAGSHFHPIRDSYQIYRSFVRFTGASLLSAALDLALFWLLFSALDTAQVGRTALLATVGARVVSGLFNFFLNRTWSFSTELAPHAHRARRTAGSAHSHATAIQLLKYGALFLCQMLASGAATAGLIMVALPALPAKMLVDSSLFVLSYYVQRRWVFATPKPHQISRQLSRQISAGQTSGKKEGACQV